MIDEQHIASAFDRDLEDIQANLMRMGGLVEQAIKDATRALTKHDGELADQVRGADKKVDALDEQIHSECARLIALRQPIASDLRVVLSVMKITSNLERVGDYAKNMAKRTKVVLSSHEIEGASGSIKRMSREVEKMLTDALDAYIRHDVELADDVRHRDIEVDQMYTALFREFLTFMIEDPRNITACMHYHFIAKNIERMGDHVVAIADQTIYQATGRMPEDSRPKAMSDIYDVPGDGDA